MASNNTSSSSNNNQKLITLTTIIASMLSGIVGFFAASIFFLFRVPTNPDTPIVVQPVAPSPVVQASCEGLSNQAVQTCCQTWATQNQIAVPECIGEWQFSTGECSWVCGPGN